MRKIGVFVCHCGTNIAATVDVKAVAEALGREPSVVIRPFAVCEWITKLQRDGPTLCKTLC